MVYTDTDSFVFHTKTDDIYKDLHDIKDEMGFQIILFIINAMILLIKRRWVNLRMNAVAKLLQGSLDFVLSVTLFKSMEKKKNIRNARARQKHSEAFHDI